LSSLTDPSRLQITMFYINQRGLTSINCLTAIKTCS
jgi:hypothetical protein